MSTRGRARGLGADEPRRRRSAAHRYRFGPMSGKSATSHGRRRADQSRPTLFDGPTPTNATWSSISTPCATHRPVLQDRPPRSSASTRSEAFIEERSKYTPESGAHGAGVGGSLEAEVLVRMRTIGARCCGSPNERSDRVPPTSCATARGSRHTSRARPRPARTWTRRIAVRVAHLVRQALADVGLEGAVRRAARDARVRPDRRTGDAPDSATATRSHRGAAAALDPGSRRRRSVEETAAEVFVIRRSGRCHRHRRVTARVRPGVPVSFPSTGTILDRVDRRLHDPHRARSARRSRSWADHMPAPQTLDGTDRRRPHRSDRARWRADARGEAARRSRCREATRTMSPRRPRTAARLRRHGHPDGRPTCHRRNDDGVDDRHFDVADIASPGTIHNIASTRTSRSTSSIRSCAGISLQGTATVATSGEQFERGLALLRERGSTTPRERVRSIVVVEVTARLRSYRRLPPRRDQQTLATRWLDHYVGLHRPASRGTGTQPVRDQRSRPPGLADPVPGPVGRGEIGTGTSRSRSADGNCVVHVPRPRL